MTALKKNISRRVLPVSHMVEEIVGCKWSLTVMSLISAGVNRPSALQRSAEGLTAKVLNDRLRKLLRFGIIEREMFAEVPPRVEYRLTAFGARFKTILAQIATLESDRDERTASIEMQARAR